MLKMIFTQPIGTENHFLYKGAKMIFTRSNPMMMHTQGACLNTENVQPGSANSLSKYISYDHLCQALMINTQQ